MEAVFLFCTDAGTGPDGKLSIHGIFNELQAPDFPARQDRMILVGIVEWQRDLRGRIPFAVELTDPEGMSIFSIEGHTDVEAQPESRAPAKTQLILPLNNVMFPAPGRYRIRININGTELVGPSMHLMRS
ncbi:MAG: hypothetical protein OER97_07230 [Gammaproteobacteria bacterium]|nr:hypothetical protein [Gammaproteobacteria bacterium]